METCYTTKKWYICFDGGMDYYLDGSKGYDTKEEAEQAIKELEAIHEKILGTEMGCFYASNLFSIDPYYPEPRKE